MARENAAAITTTKDALKLGLRAACYSFNVPMGRVLARVWASTVAAEMAARPMSWADACDLHSGMRMRRSCAHTRGNRPGYLLPALQDAIVDLYVECVGLSAVGVEDGGEDGGPAEGAFLDRGWVYCRKCRDELPPDLRRGAEGVFERFPLG
ncbi:hypothetical protein HK405_014113 [Cladochytrium tenue]|nr:hypothetical protein HK405_014113 [Cladochytrium tenue]